MSVWTRAITQRAVEYSLSLSLTFSPDHSLSDNYSTPESCTNKLTSKSNCHCHTRILQSTALHKLRPWVGAAVLLQTNCNHGTIWNNFKAVCACSPHHALLFHFLFLTFLPDFTLEPLWTTVTFKINKLDSNKCQSVFENFCKIPTTPVTRAYFLTKTVHLYCCRHCQVDAGAQLAGTVIGMWANTLASEMRYVSRFVNFLHISDSIYFT